MWYLLRAPPNAAPALGSAAAETLESTFRTVVVATVVVCLLWQTLAIVSLPGESMMRAACTAFAIVLCSALALWLLPKQLLVAQAAWQLGLFAIITLCVYVFRQPMVGLFYALLPLVAAVTLGWPASLLAECLVCVLVWWVLPGTVALPLSIVHDLRAIIIIGGFTTGLLGSAATHALFTSTIRSLAALEKARETVKEAFDQQEALKQTQEDLILANNELARLSDRLRVMQQVAEEARRAKEQFVANVSHELRTPLNMIIGFSEMITQSPHIYGTTLPSTLLADIKAIQRNSQHLARLVNDVLDLSQVEAGRMTLSREWAAIAETISSAVGVVQPLYQSKGLYLVTEIPRDLPEVFIDEIRVRQVVINLLSNAGRFTESGGVRILVQRQGTDIVITVADTGPGISLEDQRKLFEPFQQLSASIRRRHDGSGLGLSISRRFVEMHGGKIWVESPSAAAGSDHGGPGTAIHFSLPAEAVSGPGLDAKDARRWFSPYEDYAFRSRTRRSRAPAPAPGPRYVLIEEGTVLRQLLQRYLGNADIVPVRDVQEAMGALNHAPAQALIANTPAPLSLPIPVAGPDSLPYRTPLISCWVPGKGEAARQLGVVEYLVKPIAAQDLLAALDGLGDGIQRVLLVDDEPEILQLFSRVISAAHRDYQVIRAMSGQRALELLRDRQPDVMLLDLVMPHIDGFQVLREKAEDPTIRDIPVIVISSRDPARGPVVSSALTVAQGGGLSISDLVACIQSVSDVLAPSAPPVRSERQAAPVG